MEDKKREQKIEALKKLQDKMKELETLNQLATLIEEAKQDIKNEVPGSRDNLADLVKRLLEKRNRIQKEMQEQYDSIE